MADVQRLMQKSGLIYSMHSAGTTVGKVAIVVHVPQTLENGTNYSIKEGTWEAVMKLIGQAHTMLHEKGVLRIQTDIRVGSRYVLVC